MSVNIDIDLRDKLGAARDQGSRPTCLVFAASAAHEASRMSREYLATEYLFHMGARRSHQDPRRGLTTMAIQEALREDGQPLETVWPYLREAPDPAKWRPPAPSGTIYKATLTFGSRTLREVRDVLMTGRPVLLVVALTTAMYMPDRHGVVRVQPYDKITMRRHALLAIGSGHADDGGYILVRNSWGLSWGDRGHGWLHDPYLQPQLQTTAILDCKT